jgi:hypothetical protein
MTFANEKQFEEYIRELIRKYITSKNKHIFALTNKKAVDIVICKNSPTPHLYFIEIKYYVNSHGRLGFGGGKGVGLQPEILSKRPQYFENNLRWILSTKENDKIYFLTNDILLKYIAGGVIGPKHNNIQSRLFREEKGLSEKAFIRELRKWLAKD